MRCMIYKQKSLYACFSQFGSPTVGLHLVSGTVHWATELGAAKLIEALEGQSLAAYLGETPVTNWSSII